MIRKNSINFTILVLILSFTSQHISAQTSQSFLRGELLRQTSQSFLTGELLIKIRENVSIENARAVLNTYGIEFAKTRMIPRLFRYKVPARLNLSNVLEQIKSLTFVEYAEPNFITFSSYAWDPDDEYYDPGSGLGQWSLRSEYEHSIDADLAWDKVKGAGQKIAILDAGINGHADFDSWNKIWKQFDWVDHSDFYDPDDPLVLFWGQDPDTDRYIIRATGDYPDTDNVAIAEHWHGFQVAGIAAAKTDNSYGIAGVAPDALLVVARVVATYQVNHQTRATEEDPWEEEFTGEYYDGILYDDLADAIWWATDVGDADVINISLRLIPPLPIEGSAIQTAINHAVDNHVVVVAASGNESLEDPYNLPIPAKLNNVIAVGATDTANAVWEKSNWNSTQLDLVAPGVNMWVVMPTNESEPDTGLAEDYHLNNMSNEYFQQKGWTWDWMAGVNGTSFAASLVSGTAALLRSYIPDLDHSCIETVLEDTAEDTES